QAADPAVGADGWPRRLALGSDPAGGLRHPRGPEPGRILPVLAQAAGAGSRGARAPARAAGGGPAAAHQPAAQFRRRAAAGLSRRPRPPAAGRRRPYRAGAAAPGTRHGDRRGGAMKSSERIALNRRARHRLLPYPLQSALLFTVWLMLNNS